ncbi:dephospho-CoA kinase [Peptoniphilus sp. KCTC 25270]|uniref:dephospho-CoA kinase n=1 Tax=Peptoniphilus sp. KCTC 25270 TaxID=2897414 RepID=UPI001E42AF22|nr:dephospho-CoA kinase [Peptoniphilus sp. KCTC 25270]MCD1146896.1 dephospho-CoA kinase [Peptoniphilus sp. KCTC 25270]
MKQNKRWVGITGGIASGKSQATEYIRKKGYTVIDADVIAREVVEPNSEGLQKIREFFGEEIIKEGRLDREKMGALIFREEEKREALNKLLHPLIFQKMEEEGDSAQGKIVFFDIPLLFETMKKTGEFPIKFHEIWLIDTEDSIRIKRLMERDKISCEYAKEKMNSQMPMEEKRERSDIVINNSGTIELLKKQIDDALMVLEETVCEEI